MAWYNNLGDLAGDVGDILKGKNPSNKAPPVSIPAGPLPVGGSPMPSFPPQTGFALPNTSMPSSSFSDTPTDPASTDSGNGGGFDWLGALKQVASIGGDVLGFLNDHKDAILQAASVANSAYNQSKANSYATQALKQSQDAYDAKAPLRVAGISGMQFAASHGNPFSGSAALPVATPPAPGPMGHVPTPPNPPAPNGPIKAFLDTGKLPSGGSPLAPTAPALTSPAPAVRPTAQPLPVAASGSSVPSSAPSQGRATTPPNPGGSTAGPLRVATRSAPGKPHAALARSNQLELQKLYS